MAMGQCPHMAQARAVAVGRYSAVAGLALSRVGLRAAYLLATPRSLSWAWTAPRQAQERRTPCCASGRPLASARPSAARRVPGPMQTAAASGAPRSCRHHGRHQRQAAARRAAVQVPPSGRAVAVFFPGRRPLRPALCTPRRRPSANRAVRVAGCSMAGAVWSSRLWSPLPAPWQPRCFRLAATAPRRHANGGSGPAAHNVVGGGVVVPLRGCHRRPRAARVVPIDKSLVSGVPARHAPGVSPPLGCRRRVSRSALSTDSSSGRGGPLPAASLAAVWRAAVAPQPTKGKRGAGVAPGHGQRGAQRSSSSLLAGA